MEKAKQEEEKTRCPRCGSENLSAKTALVVVEYTCDDCKYKWKD